MESQGGSGVLDAAEGRIKGRESSALGATPHKGIMTLTSLCGWGGSQPGVRRGVRGSRKQRPCVWTWGGRLCPAGKRDVGKVRVWVAGAGVRLDTSRHLSSPSDACRSARPSPFSGARASLLIWVDENCLQPCAVRLHAGRSGQGGTASSLGSTKQVWWPRTCPLCMEPGGRTPFSDVHARRLRVAFAFLCLSVRRSYSPKFRLTTK